MFLFQMKILLIFLFFINLNNYTKSLDVINSDICAKENDDCRVYLSEYNATTENSNNYLIQQNTNKKNLQTKVISVLRSKWIYYTSNNQSSIYVHQNITNLNKRHNSIDNENENQQTKEIFQVLKNKILTFSKPFDASINPESSHQCRIHTKKFFDGIENFNIWALQMYDSSARLGSGILNGNINQLGDFDQCLASREPSNAFRGKYCIAYIQPKLLNRSERLKRIFQLIQSYEAFKSDINDPGHRVPRFSLINWGLCLPSSCTAQDVEYSLNAYLKNATDNTGISLQVKVEPEMCQTDDSLVLDNNTLMVIGFFTFMIFISILSTVYDYITKKQSQNEWYSTFSFKKNIKWLFSTTKSEDDISVIHGIRFLNAFMLLLAHKSLALFFVPYINRTQMSESLGQSWTVIGRAASLYTDPFLLFSGMLSSYSIIGKLQKGKTIRLRDEYIARFFRITPPLIALILFCTFVLPLLGSGPQWNLVVGHHAVLCKKYWWRNLLFIHNYFGFANMCLTHTHHVGIDTQLFILTPFATLALWKWPKKTIYVLLMLGIFGTVARFYTTIHNELSNYIYFGTTIQRLFRTADYMYSFPPYRSTVYIMGLLLGYFLRINTVKNLKINQIRFGWILSTICCVLSIMLPAPMGNINYKYNSFHAASYAAIAPLAWCLYFSWTVFVSYIGHKNFITRLLSWKGFQITTKLSYAIYLTQFPVFFYNVGRRRHSDYFRFIPLMLNFNELFFIIFFSIMLTLLFEAPFQNIKKIILKKSVHVQSSQTSNEKKIQ